MAKRQNNGIETRDRLLNWTKDSAAAEMLTAHILRHEDYGSIDLSHPFGGPDGGKDMICIKEKEKWIGASYFARGQQSFSAIKKKYKSDLEGVKKNGAVGIAFVTNQELSLIQREELAQIDTSVKLDLFHLERLSSLLDSNALYGVRLDFLDIEMSREEQLSFIASRDEEINNLRSSVQELLKAFKEDGSVNKQKLDEIWDKISKSGTPAHNGHYVIPTYLNSFGATGLFNARLHNCSHCKYGYKVGTPMGVMSWGSGRKVITCPKCGNVEYSDYI